MRSAATVALLMAVALTAPAFAGKPEKHKPKDKRGASAEVSVTVVFTPREREHVRTYFVERHGRGRCPPGLAKKHNGCLPPGQAKKRYVAGRALPAGVDLAPLPRDPSPARVYAARAGGQGSARSQFTRPSMASTTSSVPTTSFTRSPSTIA